MLSYPQASSGSSVLRRLTNSPVPTAFCRPSPQQPALPIFLMTLALTAVLRHRVASGRLAWSPTALESRFRRLSLPLLARASVLTMLGLIVLAPAAVGILYEQGLVPMTLYQFTVFNISYGAAIGIVLTPLIVLAAMAEKPVYSARMQQ